MKFTQHECYDEEMLLYYRFFSENEKEVDSSNIQQKPLMVQRHCRVEMLKMNKKHQPNPTKNAIGAEPNEQRKKKKEQADRLDIWSIPHAYYILFIWISAGDFNASPDQPRQRFDRLCPL